MSLTRDIKTLAPDDASSKEKLPTSNSPSQFYLRSNMLMQQNAAGLNPLVDAAGLLFSLVGKLKYQKTYRQLATLQQEILQEVGLFTETISGSHYAPEMVVVCRFILCATIDDIFAHTAWGNEQRWDKYSLLLATNQDTDHHDKFFAVLTRALQEPEQYLDLMELLYIALSLGYKGNYRGTEHSQYQLEQIVDQLFKHIRTKRGYQDVAIAPILLPAPNSKAKRDAAKKPLNLLYLFIMTACIIMSIFIGLGYLTDFYTNEAQTSLTDAKLATPLPNTHT